MSVDPLRPERAAGVHTRRRRNGGSDIFAVEPTFFSRRECKYIVDPLVVPDVREFLRPFMRPDDFAARREGHRYPICSLYLDSPDLALYQQTVCGEKDRFKLRVRTYSDDPNTPAFFEVKRKLNTIVHKRRAAVNRDMARRMLTDGTFDFSGLGGRVRADAEYFDQHALLIEARPVIRVKYLREAYQSKGNEPVRITIDTDLMHATTLDDSLSHTQGRWTATPLSGTIIEVKFTERFPSWVHDFVRAFGLFQRAVPKYVYSVDHMMMEGREAALALAGVTLPPRRRT